MASHIQNLQKMRSLKNIFKKERVKCPSSEDYKKWGKKGNKNKILRSRVFY